MIKHLEIFLAYLLNNSDVLYDGTVVEQRKLVERIGNIKIEIFPGDHDPPHFHVRYPDNKINARFSLNEVWNNLRTE